jgi:glycosyltransferase involved in cell wall biosynthesis
MKGSADGGGRPRVCFVVSSPMTAEAFLAVHVRALSDHFDVHLVVNSDPAAIMHPDLARATIHRARIERAISPIADLQGLTQLYRIMRRECFSAVHSVTPKAGLLTAIAAFLARVPLRFHTYTGQVWATRRGLGRTLLKALDTVIARLNTHLFVDSASQRDFLRNEAVLAHSQGIVLGHGSVCGVDTDRFRPHPAARTAVRSELGIPETALVYLFVGRLTRDKGVLELAAAFADVARDRKDSFLVLVGPDEDNLEAPIREACTSAATRVRFVEWSTAPERYMAAADVFCLPSHREGFGSTIIEAAAAGLPATGSRIYGVTDAIEDGVTGVLFERGDVAGLAAAMRTLDDPDTRAAMGVAARSRAVRDFAKASISAALVAFYTAALPCVTAGTKAGKTLTDHDLNR